MHKKPPENLMWMLSTRKICLMSMAEPKIVTVYYIDNICSMSEIILTENAAEHFRQKKVCRV